MSRPSHQPWASSHQYIPTVALHDRHNVWLETRLWDTLSALSCEASSAETLSSYRLRSPIGEAAKGQVSSQPCAVRRGTGVVRLCLGYLGFMRSSDKCSVDFSAAGSLGRPLRPRPAQSRHCGGFIPLRGDDHSHVGKMAVSGVVSFDSASAF